MEQRIITVKEGLARGYYIPIPVDEREGDNPPASKDLLKLLCKPAETGLP